MKLSIHISQNSREENLHLPLGWEGIINKLLWIHIGVYLAFQLLYALGAVLDLAHSHSVSTLIRDYIALPGHANDRPLPWIAGLLTHQFVHLHPFELAVSVSMLWLFGHILSHAIGERKVVFVYCVSIVVAAVIFLLSHVVFKVFSGYGAVMEGALSGALGVMTTTVVLYSATRLRLFGHYIAIWQLYASVLAVIIAFLVKPSLAYVLMYLCSIWVGGQFAVARLQRNPE